MAKQKMIKTIINRIKQVLSNSLNATRGNFFCFLPYKIGVFKSFFLRRIFSGIRMEQEQINVVKGIPKNALLVLTTKYKSIFEFLFAYTRYKQVGLPAPQLAFDYSIYFFQPISRFFKICVSHLDYVIRNHKIPNPYDTQHYKKKIMNSKTALLSLVEKKGFYLRFVKKRHDPLRHLIEVQKETSHPIYIVPQLMFFNRKPLPAEPTMLNIILGNSQRPGRLRKIITLLRSPSKIFVEISQPLNLQHWLNQPEQKKKTPQHQASVLRNQLLLQHNRHRRTITGPSLKSREEVKEFILTNQRMRIFMKEYSQSKQIPLYKVSKKANSYVNEIAARYNPSTIQIMSYAVNWLINSTFDGTVVDKKGLNKIRQMSRQGPLILLPCHKSHIDYLILSHVLYRNNMPSPHIAAGKNLSFWPLGSIFRSGGAFFIRRSFKGQELYAKVFSEYVRKLLEEGFNIEIFIEGGRSRTGKLLSPKLGLISILLEAFRTGVCEDMFFVPVYIGYDRIIEEHSYIHETEGGSKSPENLSQIVKARRFLKKRYGKIYINFHDPISIKDFISKNYLQTDKISKTKHRKICQNVGRQIITAIDKETVITPHGLTAAAVLNLSQHRFTCAEIISIANSYLLFAISQNAKIADTLVMSPDKTLADAFNEYKRRKLIEEVRNNLNDPQQETPCTIKENKRSLLEFYKNNCIAHFVHAATVSLAILEKEAFQFSASDLHEQHKNLTNFFKYEFAVNLERSSESFVRKTIKAFIDDSMLMPHRTIPDTYNITSPGYQKLKLYATFLKPYFESYMVVLQFFRQKSKENSNADNIREQLKKIQSIGTQMYKKGEIDLIESISKSNYSNAIKYFSERRVNSIDRINHYHGGIVKLLKLINK